MTHRRFFIFLVILAASLQGTNARLQAAGLTRARVIGSKEGPQAPPRLFPSLTAAPIFGKDDREEVSPLYFGVSKAIGMLVPGKVLNRAFTCAAGICRLKKTWQVTDNSLADEIREVTGVSEICPSEKFRNQPLLGTCSGFLLSDDILVTASHCVRDHEAEVCGKSADNQWLFGFRVTKEAHGEIQYSLPSARKCARVLYLPETYSVGEDVAILELEPTLETQERATPLKWDTVFPIPSTDRLFSIGHSLGLPQKLAFEAKYELSYLPEEDDAPVIYSDLDVFGGSSGAPILSQATGRVIGLVANGPATPQFDSYEVFTRGDGSKCGRTYQLKKGSDHKIGSPYFGNPSVEAKLREFVP